MRIPSRYAPVTLAAAAVALAGCGAGSHGGANPPAGHAAAGSTTQARLGALASVARRIYREEALGSPGHLAVARIARDRSLLAALRSGRPAAIRAAALRQLFNPGKHVVRLRVSSHGRKVVDVGGAFVVASAHGELRAPGGAPLGRLDASMQDVIGYVKLVHRLTGASVVVRGRSGHVEASSRALARAALPDSGAAAVAGRRYVVSSFREPGFAGEPLTVRVLLRTQGA